MEMTLIYTVIGFALAGYSVIANDSIQTLGTFIASKKLEYKIKILLLLNTNISYKVINLKKFRKEIMFIRKYLKWISTFLVLVGILLTNLNVYPLNIYFHGLGVVGWTIAGFISKDKAILTNFGLQIPLFVIGIYKVIF